MSTAATGAPGSRLVAIVTGDPSTLVGVEEALAPDFEFRRVPAGQLIPLVEQTPLDIMILDLDTPGRPALEALDTVEELRRAKPNLIMVAITRFQDREVRFKGRVRADEFLVAPIDLGELQMVLQRALEKRDVEIESRRVGSQAGRSTFGELIGGSEAMLRVYDAILRVAKSDTTVIIRGESGTGKELVARSIVAKSGRRTGPFISLNCAALPEALIESELFGHEKGAFTGCNPAILFHCKFYLLNKRSQDLLQAVSENILKFVY